MSTTTTALVTAVLALEVKLLPDEITLVTELINKIKGKKNPATAIKAASKVVDVTPDISYPYPGNEN